MTLSPAGRRAKGHAFERLIAQDFQELGFDCITTRAAKGGNWCATDNGVDLAGTEPFAVQCKRFKDYAPISCIEEIGRYVEVCGATGSEGVFTDPIPLLITKKDNGPTMAVLEWTELKKLIAENYRKAA